MRYTVFIAWVLASNAVAQPPHAQNHTPTSEVTSSAPISPLCRSDRIEAIAANLLRLSVRYQGPHSHTFSAGDPMQRSRDLTPLQQELAPLKVEVGQYMPLGKTLKIELKLAGEPSFATFTFEPQRETLPLLKSTTNQGQDLCPKILPKGDSSPSQPNWLTWKEMILSGARFDHPQKSEWGTAEPASDACIADIKAHYLAGHNFAVKEITDSLVPLYQLKEHNDGNFEFYHHTSAAAVGSAVRGDDWDRGHAHAKASQERSYDEIWRYVRSRFGLSQYPNLYLAGSPTSSVGHSASSGHVLTVELDPRTPVLKSEDICFAAPRIVRLTAINMIKKDFPNCDAKHLEPLIIEDSGAGLVVDCIGDWFKLTNPSYIRSTDWK